MIYDIHIPEEDYYSHMYDIESLTALNSAYEATSSIRLRNIEKTITANNCRKAKQELRTFLVDNHESVRANILQAALWVKERLFTDYFTDDTAQTHSPKSCALQELSTYLNRSPDVVEDTMLVEVPVAEDWERFNPEPTNSEEVTQFYKETKSYVYELMAANHIVQTLYSYYVMLLKLDTMNVNRVLDFGAGAGTLCILLDKAGYDVIYADLPGETFLYADWRMRQRGLDIPRVNLDEEDVSTYSFDCILSTEVVEHVVDPVGLLENFGSWLDDGNVAIISESCEYTEDFASHLEKNAQYGGEEFIKLMHDHNFRHVLKEPFIPQLFFLKH